MEETERENNGFNVDLLLALDIPADVVRRTISATIELATGEFPEVWLHVLPDNPHHFPAGSTQLAKYTITARLDTGKVVE